MASRRIRRTKSIAGYLDSLNQENLESRIRNNSQFIASGAITSSSLSEEVQILDKAIQSDNYAPGADGWRIDGGGNAEFGNVYVRGDINAYSGTIGYWNISNPVVQRTFGNTTYSGTFLESLDQGSIDVDTTSGSYVSLFKSYFDDPVNFTAFILESNKVTITSPGHNFFVGDPIVVLFDDSLYKSLQSSESAVVYVSQTTYDTISYLLPVSIVSGAAYNDTGTSDIALTAVSGTAQIYYKDVAGLYLRDYSKNLFDYGYFSNEGVKYVSAESYNLVHNPSFEYIVSNTSTYSNTGWAFGTNLVATSFNSASTVSIDGTNYEIFKDDSVYTAYSAKLTWGTNSLSSSYASIDVNYPLLKGLSDLNKTLYFDFYAYFNPAGAAVTATNIQRTNGSANVIVTAASHGLTTGEYVWNEYLAQGTIGENTSANIDAYNPLKIVAANTNTFTVTVGAAATSSANITPLVRDRIYRFHPAAYKLTDIRFKLPNANVITLYEVLTDDTIATWDANAAYTFFSLPYAKDSLGNYAVPYHAVDDSNNFVLYNLPRLSPISSTEGTPVPYEIKIDPTKVDNFYAARDATGYAAESNIQLQLPGWIYRNESTPATKIVAYANTAIYIDNISLSTEKSFFYGGADVSTQSWYLANSAPNTASILSAKTWIDIDLENQTSYLNHSDFVSFKSPLLKDKLVKNSGIYTVNDVDNIDYKPINIGTSLTSDYSSLLFTSGEYEYKLVDNTYANYESLVSSRVEKDKAFLYMSTIYKNLDADSTYSASNLNKWEASITMASGADQATEIDITAASIRLHAPAYYDTDTSAWYSGNGDTSFTVVGDAYVSGNASTGNDLTAGNDLYVSNLAYIGTEILSSDSTTNFAPRKYTDTVTSLPIGTWYTIAYNPGGSNAVSVGRATAQFVLVDRSAGKHQSVHFMASATFNDPALTILHSSAFSVNAPFEAIRIKTGGIYDGAALQVYSNGSSSSVNVQAFMYANDQTVGAWELVDFITDATDPGTVGSTPMTNYANLTARSELNLELGGGLLENKMMVDGSIVAANSANSAIYTIIQPSSSTFFGDVSIGNNLTITGNLTVNGTTTTINSTTITVDDKNIVLGNVASSTNTTADGGGISVEAVTGGDKTLTWVNATAAWTSSEDFNLLSGKVYEINGSTVLSSSQVLGYSISDANGASTIVARNSSGNFAANTITASLTGTASLATNLVGGTANKGELVYQSGVNTTAELTAPVTNNSSLFYNTSTNVPYWTQSTLSNTYYAATTSAQLANVISDETGTGNLVFNTSPTLVTPALGTPASGNLASTTGYPTANLTGLGTNVATFLTTPSSANLRNAVTDEAGTGSLVFRASTVATTSDLAIGWYTIAYIPANRGSAKFIVTDTRAGRHQVVVFQATALFDVDTAAGITVLHQSAYSLANAPIQKIRIKNGNVSSDGAVLQVFVDNATNNLTAYVYENDMPSTWSVPTNWVDDATDPGVAVYANLAAVTEVNLDSGSAGRNQMLVTGDIYAGVNAASHVLASQSYSIAANATYTLATNNTNQSLFPALANGVAVESGFRYEIEGTFVVSHTVTTITNGTVSDVLSTSFNVPSLTYGWMEYGYATSTTATFAAGTTDTITGDVVTTTLTNDAIANSISRSTTGTTSGYIYIRFRGVVKTSAAGNILPRIKFNYTDAGGVGSNSGIIQAGSWMRVTKVAETTSGWT